MLWEVLYFATAVSSCSGFLGNQRQQQKHNLRSLSPLPLSNLQRAVAFNNHSHFMEVLDPFNQPRVVGSHGHAIAREHIVGALNSLGWTVEENIFDDNTPIGVKTFTNIIATLNPAATYRLVLACHYESKMTPKGFIGAIDSAVPCAMLLNLAYVMQNEFEIVKRRRDLTIQFIFFDGEEAFIEWTSKDSLYGSRHLAKEWQNTNFPPRLHFDSSLPTELDRIELFVLLDLLGSKNTAFVNFFPTTHQFYKNFLDIEHQLRRLRLVHPNAPQSFRNFNHSGRVDDDHVPFLERGVPILHLISVPFPDVWHTIDDDFAHLDFDSIAYLNTLLRSFVMQYLL